MNHSPTFVHIVESPSSIDLLDGRTEGRSLSAFLDLAEIPNVYCLATNASTFEMAMNDRLAEGVEKHNAFPIIHLSAHGNKNEIALTNDERIPWETLGNELGPINATMNGSLVLCLSACSGLSANNMIWKSDDLPMKTLVASRGDIDWHEAAVAFATFYNHFLKLGKSIDESVNAMKAASGRDDFVGSDSARLQGLIDRVQAIPVDKLRELVQTLNERENDP